jgi:hypothetical protein
MTKLWNLSEELMMGKPRCRCLITTEAAKWRCKWRETVCVDAKKDPAEAGPFVHKVLLIATATTGRRISQ